MKVAIFLLACALVCHEVFGAKPGETCQIDGDCGQMVKCEGATGSKTCICRDAHCQIGTSNDCSAKGLGSKAAGEACCDSGQCGAFGALSSAKCVNLKCSSAGVLVASLLSTLAIVVAGWMFK